MIEFKACSRCRGDVKMSSDVYGTYRQCLQCGRMQDVFANKVITPEPARKREPTRKKHRAA